jgi:RNA polymerase sigma factor (sigma-70 family)
MREGSDAAVDAATYEALAPELIRYATGLVGRHDAADLLSTVVLRALGSEAWRSVVDHRAYLYRALTNEARRWTDRSRRRFEREHRAALQWRWELPEFDPEVRAAVDELSVRQRAVTVLTYWDDHDPATIADLLGISEGAVRRHLARARARLREVLS